MKHIMSNSLSNKLIISTSASLAIVALLFFGFLAAVLHWYPQWFLQQDLRENVDRVAAGVHYDASGKFSGVILRSSLQDTFDALQVDNIYRVLDKRGTLLASSDGANQPLLPENSQFIPKDFINTNFVMTRSGVTLHVITKLITRQSHQFFVQIGRSERMHQVIIGNDLADFRLAAVIANIIAIFIFTLVVWLTFNRMLRPLRIASEAASKIESNNLHTRLSMQGIPLELTPLIEAFNKALDRLERGYRAQQEFLATVAHELKTPLALIRGEIELGGLTNRDLLLKDIDRMARQTQQLLYLTEVSDHNNFFYVDIDPTEMIKDAVEHLRRLADRLNISIHLELPPQKTTLHADASAMFVLVKNLLENALLHSPEDSEILIILTQDMLRIRDHGYGIPSEDVPFLYKRFWRGSNRRDNGAGLGLAICHEIVLAHGWTLTVHPDQSPGAEFVVSFDQTWHNVAS